MREPSSTAELLRVLLAANWDPERVQIPDQFPWSDVVSLAQSERVAPLLYAALTHAAQAGVGLGTDRLPVPDGPREALAQSYYLAARDNALRSHELITILDAMAATGAATILVKGLALAETLYGNVALRPMTDFDLVVHPESVPACREILLGLGYVPIDVEITPGSNLAYRNEEVFADPERRRAPVELHWHLLDVPYHLQKIPMDWFWSNSETHHISGSPVQVLNPEANVIYLSAHLALHHRFQGLRWFVDLAVLVQRHQVTLDWETVAQAAQRFELLLVVRETLDRLADYWPSLPLDGGRAWLHALEPTVFEARLFRLLTAEPRTPLLDFYADLVGLPDLRARARFLLLNTFPQRTYMARRYRVERSWQLPYWYLYRLRDGLVKLARTVPQVLRLRSH